mmetsp:Transcript_18156/g.32523  ORF Transcript_18156/g.32523 Transcript_18156/m.32523 type:complete len:320 (-) Transcript_18156:1528-2487(-)
MKKSKSFLAPFDGLISKAGKARTMFIVNSDISGMKSAAESKYLDCFEQSASKQFFDRTKEDTDKLVAKELKKINKLKASKTTTKVKSSFSFASQSREGAYDSIVTVKKYRRERVPPQGHYRVNFKLVEKNSPNRTIYKTIAVDRRTPTHTVKEYRHKHPASTSNHRKDNCPVNFAKMLDRPWKPKGSPDEQRFTNFDRDTPVYSKNKRVMSISFDKSISRDDLYNEALSRTFDAIYDARKEKLMPNLGKTLPFYRSCSRPELFKPKEDINQVSYRMKAVEKKTRKVDLQHAKPRRKNTNLPLFLQDMHDRFAVAQVLQG